MSNKTTPQVDHDALIAGSVWLASVSPDFAHAVLNAAGRTGFSRGTLIYERGDPPGGLFGVVEGLVSVGMDDSKSSTVAGHIFKPGDWFGETPTVARSSRQIDAMALRDCTLLTVSMQAMRNICEKTPQGWRWLAVLMAINADVAVQIARDLLVSSPRQRIISVVRRLIGRTPLPVELMLTQAELAEMCALSRGVVSRVLGELEAEGAIRRNYGSLTFPGHPIWRGI